MAAVAAGRFTADVEGDFVVFIIGMRFNKPLRVRKWLPVSVAMPKMLRYLDKNPQAGLLGYRAAGGLRTPTIIQYWRSFEELERFAKAPEAPHLGPWRKFVKNVGSSGDVGIWHETYIVKPCHYEAVYSGMPPYGLGKVGKLVAATGKREAARSRMISGVPSQ